ncbi:MAG: MBL fold metallo-hydrolase RNA specificity domain-containing protein, partial [Pseudomonadales bacterium]
TRPATCCARARASSTSRRRWSCCSSGCAAKEQFDFNPATIDAVVLSHGHLDHSGLLPKLVHSGFSGPIYCTPATKGLLKILLEDSWGLYQRDIEHTNRRRQRAGKKLLTLEYSERDVNKVLKLCEPVPYKTQYKLGPSTTLCFHDAGHILGSAIVELTITEDGKDKRLVFSGDLGNADSALMRDPAELSQADVLLMESTYGNRNHRDMGNTLEQFSTILSEAWQRGGTVMIPAFAVGRTQEIIYHLGCLHKEGKLDNWTVFLDSPMAIDVTQVYDNWLNILDRDDIKCLTDSGRESLEEFLPKLRLTDSTDQSMAINKIESGAIIIAGSGMCTGGRIRHHFKHRIWNRKNTIIFAGFQAQGTLGRLLVDGVRKIKMFGDDFVVKANIETLGGFSAHAGQKELIQWANNFSPVPRLILIHGEISAMETLSAKLLEDHNIASEIPSQGDSIEF